MKLALIGDPVAHSRSPQMQAEFLREAGITGSYEAIRVARGDVAATLRRLQREGYHGINVTTPLKEEAFAFCTEVDDVSAFVRGVNTITLGDVVRGANTDGIGARAALEAALGGLAGRTIAVIGAGPTARVAAFELARCGAEVAVWNRTLARARELVSELRTVVPDAAIALASPGATYDAAFATLPPASDLGPEVISLASAARVVVDANYGARSTLATQLRREIIDGGPMLAAGGRASFEIWRASRPS